MKTPKLIPIVIVSQIVAVCLAQPPRMGGAGGRGGAGAPPLPPPPVAGDMSPLGPLADKFHGFQRAQLEGEKFYVKEENELQKIHAESYRLIADYLVGDKISEEKGEAFVTSLINIGAAHLAAKTSGATPATDASLRDLQIDVKAAARQEVKQEELTPDLNRVQLLMSELVRFAADDSKLSSKASTIKRRLDGFISKEVRAKEDREVNDREREKLSQESTQSWGEVIQVLQR